MPQGFLPPLALGWNTRDPVTAMRPGFAHIFDNYVVEGGEPRVRRGYRVWATGLPGRVDGLLAFNGAGTARRLFAASGASLYDVTAVGAVGAAAVSGMTSARWSGINVAAAGASFLFAFNGADTAQTFNGTTWGAWTATGVPLPVAWAGQFKGRLFVGNPSRMSFWYGGAGAIAGAFTEFPLQGVAGLGGGVCAVTTLSGDGGSGPQDLIVFLTTEGEAIVYEGTDPSQVSAWALVGRWRIPRPLGAPHRCVATYGGDALALTESGLLPLSALRSGADVGTVMERAGMTRRIAPTWRRIVQDRGALAGWEVAPLTRLAQVVVNAPWTAAAAQQIVVSDGGAVSRWNGIAAACWAEALNGSVFVGEAGRVLLYGEDNADAGAGIRSEGLTGFSALGAPARVKRATLVQEALRDALAIERECRVFADWSVPLSQADELGFAANAPALPLYTGEPNLFAWDVGAWDQMAWGGLEQDVRRKWQSASQVGHAVAVRLRMVSGQTRPAWVGTNIIYEVGGPVR